MKFSGAPAATAARTSCDSLVWKDAPGCAGAPAADQHSGSCIARALARAAAKVHQPWPGCTHPARARLLSPCPANSPPGPGCGQASSCSFSARARRVTLKAGRCLGEACDAWPWPGRPGSGKAPHALPVLGPRAAAGRIHSIFPHCQRLLSLKLHSPRPGPERPFFTRLPAPRSRRLRHGHIAPAFGRDAQSNKNIYIPAYLDVRMREFVFIHT